MTDAFQNVLTYAEANMSEGDYLKVADALKKAFTESSKTSQRPLWERVQMDLSWFIANDVKMINYEIEKAWMANRRSPGQIMFAYHIKYSITDIKTGITSSPQIMKATNLDDSISRHIRLIKPTQFTLHENGNAYGWNRDKYFADHTEDCFIERKRMLELEKRDGKTRDEDEDDWDWHFDIDDVFYSHIRMTLRDGIMNAEEVQHQRRNIISSGGFPDDF